MQTGSDKTAVDEDLGAPEAVEDDRLDEVKPRSADDELVAIVNMLESKPASTFRSEATAGAVDEDVQEIPDED
ncbi:hypothetical protein ONZ45_g19635 [Pleurotus djamor]|nr:hypothetical protein ONZ45_g19635 [Pleurotus djamor]